MRTPLSAAPPPPSEADFTNSALGSCGISLGHGDEVLLLVTKPLKKKKKHMTSRRLERMLE
jgi:hypothetical protein